MEQLVRATLYLWEFLYSYSQRFLTGSWVDYPSAKAKSTGQYENTKYSGDPLGG